MSAYNRSVEYKPHPTGIVLVECNRCGEEQYAKSATPSSPWPQCKVCGSTYTTLRGDRCEMQVTDLTPGQIQDLIADLCIAGAEDITHHHKTHTLTFLWETA